MVDVSYTVCEKYGNMHLYLAMNIYLSVKSFWRNFCILKNIDSLETLASWVKRCHLFQNKSVDSFCKATKINESRLVCDNVWKYIRTRNQEIRFSLGPDVWFWRDDGSTNTLTTLEFGINVGVRLLIL